uniref:Nicotinamide N-methyltransferase n=1 Tax=Salvator merianae TaxID=96440 RepID=A0A8D0E8C1_SALMN
MEVAFTEKDFYAEHFVPKDYLENYYSFSPGKDGANALLRFSLDNLHQAFGAGGIKGDTLIDIGTGPTIYQFLSACESFREIIATDYTDQNREELQRWLKGDLDAFDWTPVVKYVCELEGDREKWAEKENKVRRAIRQVLKCDVTQPDPLAPQVVPPADCLLSFYCVESAAKDLPTYRSALKNISSLVKPGGHLVFHTILEDTFYMVGPHPFSCLYLRQKDVEEAVKEAGFAIQWLKETRVDFPFSVTDAKGACTVVAQKIHS